jgi:hypothetical protein
MTGGAGRTGTAEPEACGLGVLLGVLQVCWGFNPPTQLGHEKIPAYDVQVEMLQTRGELH